MSKFILTALTVLSMSMAGIGQASAQQLECYVAAVIYHNGNKIPANVLARAPVGNESGVQISYFKPRYHQWAGTTSANYDIREIAANACIANARGFMRNQRGYWQSVGYPNATGRYFYKLL